MSGTEKERIEGAGQWKAVYLNDAPPCSTTSSAPLGVRVGEP